VATITATIDDHGVDLAKGIITGTFDTTENEGAANGLAGPAVDQIVLGTSRMYLTGFYATCQNGAGVVRAKVNYNSAGVATLGTVLIESNCIGAETFRFVAYFKNM